MQDAAGRSSPPPSPRSGIHTAVSSGPWISRPYYWPLARPQPRPLGSRQGTELTPSSPHSPTLLHSLATAQADPPPALTTRAAVCSLVACGSNHSLRRRPHTADVGAFAFLRGRRQPLPPPVTPTTTTPATSTTPPPPTGASAREISPGLGAATVVDYAHPPPSAATRVLIYSATHSLTHSHFHSRPRHPRHGRLQSPYAHAHSPTHPGPGAPPTHPPTIPPLGARKPRRVFGFCAEISTTPPPIRSLFRRIR